MTFELPCRAHRDYRLRRSKIPWPDKVRSGASVDGRQPRDQIVGRGHVAEFSAESHQSRIVLVFGVIGIRVTDHCGPEVQQHRVAGRTLATGVDAPGT